MTAEHVPEGTVGEDPGEVVDASVSLRFADHGDDGVGIQGPAGYELLELIRVVRTADELNFVNRATHGRMLGPGAPGARGGTPYRVRSKLAALPSYSSPRQTVSTGIGASPVTVRHVSRAAPAARTANVRRVLIGVSIAP